MKKMKDLKMHQSKKLLFSFIKKNLASKEDVDTENLKKQYDDLEKEYAILKKKHDDLLKELEQYKS